MPEFSVGDAREDGRPVQSQASSMQATLDALPEVLFRADWYLHADVADEFHDDFSESTLLGSLGLACYENEASSSARCDMRATTHLYINSIVKTKGLEKMTQTRE